MQSASRRDVLYSECSTTIWDVMISSKALGNNLSLMHTLMRLDNNSLTNGNMFRTKRYPINLGVG